MGSFDIETTSRGHGDTNEEEEKTRLLRHGSEEHGHQGEEEEEQKLHVGNAIVLCCILTIASCSSSILAQLSKHGESGEYGYHTSTVPVLSEFAKLVISSIFVGYTYVQTGSIHAPLWTVKEFCTKYLVIGFLYAIQNNLVFIALMYLDPGTMEVLGNVKLPLTAVLMRFLLHKVFSSIQVVGLAFLTIGAMLSKFNLVSCGEGPDEDCSKSRIGILIMIVMCCISSTASVANEYLLKHKDNGPLFWQNSQLYLSTCFFSILHAAFIDRVPMNGGFFEGYSWMTLAVILNLAFVGIIVSITLKHADNIVHAIASILAMILATVFSVIVLDAELHILSIFGFACISAGVLMYFFSNACSMHCLQGVFSSRGNLGTENLSSRQLYERKYKIRMHTTSRTVAMARSDPDSTSSVSKGAMRVASIAASALIAFTPYTVGGLVHPQPAHAASSNGSDVGVCVLKKCQKALAGCLGDPQCLENLVCLQQCNGKDDETACQIKCGDRYQDAAIDTFNKCAVSDKKCVPQRVDEGVYPIPPDCALDTSFDLTMFQGRWYITAGLNPLFDTFPCQEHYFASPKDSSDVVFAEINWRIPASDGKDFIQRSTMQRFVQTPDNPAILLNHDNEFLHYEDDWYIIASKPDAYVFIYYRGQNDAWKGYGGATVYTRDSHLPEEYVPELRQAAENVGLSWDDFTITDNSCPPKPVAKGPFEELKEDLTLAEDFANKEMTTLIEPELKSFGKGFTILEKEVESVTREISREVQEEEKVIEKQAQQAARRIRRFQMEASMGKWVQAIPLPIRELIMPVR